MATSLREETPHAAHGNTVMQGLNVSSLEGSAALRNVLLYCCSPILPPNSTHYRASKPAGVKFYILITDEFDRYGTYTYS